MFNILKSTKRFPIFSLTVQALLFLLFLLASGTKVSFAQIVLSSQSTEVSLDTDLPIFGAGKQRKNKMSKKARALYKIKASIGSKKYKRCLDQIGKHRKTYPNLAGWFLAKEIRCSYKRSLQLGSTKNLEKLIRRLEKNEQQAFRGAHSWELTKYYVSTYLHLFKKYRGVDTKKAWRLVGALLKQDSVIKGEKRASIYARASGIAKTYGKKAESIRFLEISLEAGVRKSAIREYKKLTGRDYKKASSSIKDLERISTSEKKSIKKLQSFFYKKRFNRFLKKSISFLKTYKAGSRVKWVTENLGRAYFRTGRGRKKNSIKRKMFKDLSSWHLLAVAEYLSVRHRYKEANEFSVRAYELYKKGQTLEPKKLQSLLWTLASSEHYLGNYDRTSRFLQEALKNSLRAKADEKILFRLGLVYLRQEKWIKAKECFEKILDQEDSEEYNLLSRYWLWRTYQKLKDSRQKNVVQSMIKKYPLTYYSLRARAELNEMRLKDYKKETHSFKVKLSSSGYISFQRYKLFLQAGWLEEAQAEIPFVMGLSSGIGPVSTDEGVALLEIKDPNKKLFLARLFYLSQDFFQSIFIASDIWEKHPDKINWPQLELSFPVLFKSVIKKQSRRSKVDVNLLFALIKQESSFRQRALSSAGARGLMQVLPSTARETERLSRLRVRNITRKLYDPGVNILVGSAYLKRMIRAFDGNVLLALAAYNAGIGHIRRWTELRLDTQDIQRNSNPLNELWIDELPWDETRFYVKAIMRNYLIYKLKEQGDFFLSNPIWSSSIRLSLKKSN